MFWECKLNNEEIEPGILSKYVHRLIQERKKPVYFLVKYLQSRYQLSISSMLFSHAEKRL